MIISIASGKGGTGKTTLATNLAKACETEQLIQLLDCDVEAPNAHLFLNPKIDHLTPAQVTVPLVDVQACTFCKKCMEICRFGAIAVLKEDVLVFQDLCHSCGGCVEVCSYGAITEKKKIIGEIESGSAGGVSFAHGRLGVGQVMVPPVIKKVRQQMDTDGVIIVDAPPGTSCPVISAVNHTDFVVLVTEPTPFGLHDLKLAVQTIEALEIPFGLVINRAGIGNNDVINYAREKNIPVLMEIPFDRRIAMAYSSGDMMVDVIPGYRQKFVTLLNEIICLVEQEGRAI